MPSCVSCLSRLYSQLSWLGDSQRSFPEAREPSPCVVRRPWPWRLSESAGCGLRAPRLPCVTSKLLASETQPLMPTAPPRPPACPLPASPQAALAWLCPCLGLSGPASSMMRDRDVKRLVPRLVRGMFDVHASKFSARGLRSFRAEYLAFAILRAP